ncbi:XRE family transcriptional regulator [Halocynthiibacter styelae]|uniref:LexA family transcriptional regulator n=1 Tax=Halocynthiibacter styelae TaxID=2761955 RepID=A0A8J7IZN9_9RHOB|nr:S24 family peptidase [Paenihalocynthiibacter styelae]MBI1495370.1 LexA family transcriptional regulator [Paenihalocynthiibacter styelae]
MSTIHERLREERIRLGMNQPDFAEVGGAKKHSQINYEKGKTSPDGDYFAAISEIGADVLYILTGTKGSEPEYSGRESLGVENNLPYLTYLPEYDISASAGPGAAVASEVIVRDIGFQEGFLHDLGASPKHCSIIRASGDSMEPTIPDGSLLVVDHSQAYINGGGIYVLGVADDLLVKRARKRIDNTIDLISDNQIYPPETIAPDRMEDLRVVGRVVYFCRTP